MSLKLTLLEKIDNLSEELEDEGISLDKIPKVDYQSNFYLISLDLKNSESLFRLGAEQGVGGSYVKNLMQHLATVVIQRNGELIASEGDSILFFIEKNNSMLIA